MANSADPDQLASSEANWSGSTLFAKAGYIRVQQDKGEQNNIVARGNWESIGTRKKCFRENSLIMDLKHHKYNQYRFKNSQTLERNRQYTNCHNYTPYLQIRNIFQPKTVDIFLVPPRKHMLWVLIKSASWKNKKSIFLKNAYIWS